MAAAQQPKINWVTTILFSVTFIIALIIVPLYGFLVGYDTAEVCAFFTLLIFSGISITGGYHRLWSHNTYKATLPVRLFFAFWGAAAVQNSILIWSSGHRRHHRYIDDNEKDPYSIKRGFWFAHIGWMLRDYPSSNLDFSNVRDLKKDPVVMLQHRYYLVWVLLSAVGVPVFLGYLNGNILGMFLLAGILRLTVNHHLTFFINSLAHMWGKQPYTKTNSAKDNHLLAFLTYGEGYHNFHHYFQNDYRNGVLWWQFDPTKWLINLLVWLRLASDLRRVPAFKIQEALVKMQFEKVNHQLAKVPASSVEVWKEALETEYQQFLNSLTEWKNLRNQWYQKKRDAINLTLCEKRSDLQNKWERIALSSKLKEIEYTLKMQHKRLSLFNVNMQSSV